MKIVLGDVVHTKLFAPFFLLQHQASFAMYLCAMICSSQLNASITSDAHKNVRVKVWYYFAGICYCAFLAEWWVRHLRIHCCSSSCWNRQARHVFAGSPENPGPWGGLSHVSSILHFATTPIASKSTTTTAHRIHTDFGPRYSFFLASASVTYVFQRKQ